MKRFNRYVFLLLGTLLLLLIAQPSLANADGPAFRRLPGDSDWDNRFVGPPGVDGTVSAIAVSPNGNVYVAGSFHWAGGIIANNVAQWNPTTQTWSPLGSGIKGEVRTIAVTTSGTVYVGGLFYKADGNAASHLVKWNGTAWSAVGSGLSSAVNSLAVSGSNLYVAGDFAIAGGKTVNCVARWSETTGSWSGLGSGVAGCAYHGPWVQAIKVIGPRVYLGGYFNKVGGVSANYVAMWNGVKWSAVGGSPSGGVDRMTVIGSNIYVSGFSRLEWWNGSSWSGLGEWSIYPPDGESSFSIDAFAGRGNVLYIGGHFKYDVYDDEGNEIIAQNVVALDTGTGVWSPMGDTGSGVFALAVAGNWLYAGGSFRTAGSATVGSVAAWDGTNWSALSANVSNSVNGPVSTLLTVGSDVYVGGVFDHAGTVPVNNLAKWNKDSNSWSDVGGGVSCLDSSYCQYPGRRVTSIIANGDKLYVMGNFDTAGDVPAMNIAVWDGVSWSALDQPWFGGLNGMAFDGSNNLYLVTQEGLDVWDGTNWTRVGYGGLINGGPTEMHAVAVNGSDVYVGGSFQSVSDGTNEIPANHVAKWNSTSGWSAVGNLADFTLSDVYSLAVNGGNLYVDGDLKWDGSSWSMLGDGIPGTVNSVAFMGNVVFAAGSFVQAGISNAGNIAAWDGAKWVPLGSGTSSAVNALAVNGADLYVGGAFTTAGGKQSSYFARFDASGPLPVPPLVSYEEATDPVQYDGWQGNTDWSFYSAHTRASNHAGDKAVFRFTGTAITWVTAVGPDRGKAQVLIDGVNKGIFNLYNANKNTLQQRFKGLSVGPHTLTIKVQGTKDDAATDALVSLNAFVVGKTITESTNKSIQYNSWQGTANAQASSAVYRLSTSKGATATFTFRGTAVNWITTRGPGMGQAEIFLDGVDQGPIDLYVPTVQWQSVIPYPGLAEGKHTLQIQVLGIRNPESTGTKVVIDAFQVAP